MIIVGINHAKGISKKSGDPYEAYVLHGVVRRYNGDIQVDSAWISPAEYDRSKVKLGDSVIVSKDGEVLVRGNEIDAVQLLLDRL